MYIFEAFGVGPSRYCSTKKDLQNLSKIYDGYQLTKQTTKPFFGTTTNIDDSFSNWASGSIHAGCCGSE
jgi:hypothetical protein